MKQKPRIKDHITIRQFNNNWVFSFSNSAFRHMKKGRSFKKEMASEKGLISLMFISEEEWLKKTGEFIKKEGSEIDSEEKVAEETAKLLTT